MKSKRRKSEPARRVPPDETRVPGRAVSRGVAMGPAVVVAESDPNPRRIALPKSAVVQECRRLENAFGSALRQLGSLTKQGALRTGDPGKAIFEAHGEILSDPLLLSETIEVIRTQRVNAEWAVMTVAERFASVLKKSKDAHLRERAGDINDVGARVRRVLDDGGRIRIPRGAIVFTEEVTPSLMVELARQGVGAICAEIGGWTSHSFIIAREAGVPAVTGIKGIHRNLSDGDPVIVDGFRGEVILRPGPESLRHFQDADLASAPSLVGAGQRKRSNTLDGVHVRVRANIDPVKGLDELGPSDAEGVGLFRSESLYQDGKGFPSESSQASAYRKIVKAAGRPGAVIRTFDLSYDRVLQSSGELERNPSLGLRGTRLMLELQKEFRAQIRALLRASAEGRLDILLPMVSDLSEVRAVRELIREESARLRSKGVKTGRPRLGAMIEVPAAVLMAKEFLAEVDFVNIGTNDLVQYTLGADRDNGAVSGYFRTLHPAVLRAVSQVVKEGRRIGKQVILCGEMAGSPAYVGVLIGLGVTDISVGFNSMPKVRRVIRGLAFEECRDVVGRMLDVSTASESEKIWENEFGKRLGALVPNLSFQGSRPQNTP